MVQAGPWVHSSESGLVSDNQGTWGVPSKSYKEGVLCSKLAQKAEAWGFPPRWYSRSTGSAPVKFSTVRYEEAKELLCGLLSSEAGTSRALSEVGGAPPAQAAPSSVHEPHTEIRAQSKRANSTFMPPTKFQILISQKPHFSTYTTLPAFNLSK